MNFGSKQGRKKKDKTKMTTQTFQIAPRTLSHLTGKEQHRVLVRLRNVAPQLSDFLWKEEWANQDYLHEIWSEQMCERGSATRHYTRLARFLQDNPVHVYPAKKPFGWSEPGSYDEVPF